MVSISLCMIVKNEEEVLGRCLDSVSDLVDEVIIVDTGSTDNTRKIAGTYTENIYEFEWIDDFAAARNYAFSAANKEYCMWMDADDILTEKDRIKFSQLKQDLSPSVSVVMMPYHTGFDEMGNVTFSYFRERIIKNNQGMKWVGAVHEVIQPAGEIYYADCAVSHHKLKKGESDRNLRIFESQILKGAKLDMRQQFYYGRELYYNMKYEKALQIFEQFLESEGGWLENKIDACCHIAYCQYALNEEEKALQALLTSFEYDVPRAEVCCEIGRHFLERERWKLAAYWYTIAITCKRDDKRGGFTSADCYGYIPCIQLCVCYSRMGEVEKAIRFNELAAEFKPESKAVLHNREYFWAI